jgi:hypothetical protein
MIKAKKYIVLLFVLISFSGAQAQQFEIITVGPQGQSLNQSQQWQQPTIQLPGQPQRQAPQVFQRVQTAPPGKSPAQREVLPERFSAFEKYVLLQISESIEREATVILGTTGAKEDLRKPETSFRPSPVPSDRLAPSDKDEKDLYVRQFGYDLFSQPPSNRCLSALIM